ASVVRTMVVAVTSAEAEAISVAAETLAAVEAISVVAGTSAEVATAHFKDRTRNNFLKWVACLHAATRKLGSTAKHQAAAGRHVHSAWQHAYPLRVATCLPAPR